MVAGMNPFGFLAMNRSLTNLGLGVNSSSSVGFLVYFLGKLRPKRIPVQPIRGVYGVELAIRITRIEEPLVCHGLV